MGRTEAGDPIIRGVVGATGNGTPTCGFAQSIQDAKEVSCSAFGDGVIRQM